MTTVLQNNNVNVQIPRHLYSSLISPENFSSDMCIGPSTINKIIVSSDNSSQLTKTATITYSSILTPQLLYSNKIEISGNVNLKFTNVKVKTNVETVASAIRIGVYDPPNQVYIFDNEEDALSVVDKENVADLTAKNGKHVDLIKKGRSAAVSSQTTGLSSNPFQAPEMCLAPSFWNCMYSSSLSLSTNGNALSLSDTTPRYHDLVCRMLPAEETESVYDCALYPDKNIIRNERLLAMSKTMGPITASILSADKKSISRGRVFGTIDKNPDGVEITDPKQYKLRGNAFVFDERIPTYNDVNLDKNNSNSKMFRGQYEKNCEYTFEKAYESYNYNIEIEKDTIDGKTIQYYKITKTNAKTTKLNAIYVNGFCFPTHFELGNKPGDITPREAYLALGDLLFFKHDNVSPLCIKSEAAIAKETTDFCYIYRNEPVNQSLIVNKVIRNYTHTLFNPLLTIACSLSCVD